MKANEASSTAKVIAASTIFLASDTRTAHLVAAGAGELCKKLLSTTRADRLLAWSAAQPLTRALWRCVERLTLPGILAHYWHRKRWLEERCRRAIADGFERVIVLGAGFDTLAYRLSREFPHVDVTEVDHPATQGAKRRALDADAEPATPPLHYLAIDLSAEPLPDSLRDDRRATIIVVEGVLMYLPELEVHRLFDSMRGLAAQDVRIFFSFMTKWPDGRSGFRPRSWLIERWLWWRDEPFAWSLAPSAVNAFLAAHRFRLVELALTRQFTHGFGAQHAAGSALDGENLVWCEPA